jgi:hypothetical protein
MTEEDTFKILRRVPFLEMCRLMDIWRMDPNDGRYTDQVLMDNGWTYDEFQEKCKDEQIKNIKMKSVKDMTEDDTFRRLKRISFSEIPKIITTWRLDLTDIRSVEKLLLDNGWTLSEYEKERIKKDV